MFLGVVFIIIFLLWNFLTQPTCFDGERNQNEENIDCGGPCDPCIVATKNPKVDLHHDRYIYAQPYEPGIEDGFGQGEV